MAGLLGGFFNFVDPILDTIDPMHNKVQTWTTGSETTEGQSPYFQTIAPMIVDYFLPGVGSAVAGLDGASTGNWGKAALGAMGAAGQLGSVGSTAAEGANGGLAATEATQASQGLSSTGGASAGTVTDATSAASAAPVDYTAMYGANTYGDGFDAANVASDSGNASGLLSQPSNFGQPANSFGYQGLSSSVDNPASSQFMTLPASQYSSAAGVGGVGQPLSETITQAGVSPVAKSSSSGFGKMALQGGEYLIKQQAQAQQQQQQEAERRRAMAMQSMASAGGVEPSRGPVQSFQNISPYAKFGGGYRPAGYGANVRKQNYGLLG